MTLFFQRSSNSRKDQRLFLEIYEKNKHELRVSQIIIQAHRNLGSTLLLCPIFIGPLCMAGVSVAEVYNSVTIEH